MPIGMTLWMGLLGLLPVLQVSDVWHYRLVSRPDQHRRAPLIVVITVGESSSWVQELVDRASKLKVGSGFDPSTDVYVCPIILHDQG
jgi:hypothetical protein